MEKLDANANGLSRYNSVNCLINKVTKFENFGGFISLNALEELKVEHQVIEKYATKVAVSRIISGLMSRWKGTWASQQTKAMTR